MDRAPSEIGYSVGESVSTRKIVDRLRLTLGVEPEDARSSDWYAATAYVIRDSLMPHWLAGARQQKVEGRKHVYYLSMEFLTGRLLGNAVLALDAVEPLKKAFAELGLDFESIQAEEPDPALGNGGLGRLAACFLDSMASLDVPAIGYGLRYEYGAFHQRLEDGWQREYPDIWLHTDNPWELHRAEATREVKFGGTIKRRDKGWSWCDTEDLLALAFDTPVPGWRNPMVNTLRLWSGAAREPISLEAFNRGDHPGAARARVQAENLTQVLYPEDSTPQGQELRLRQEYFFVSASLQDILIRFGATNSDWSLLPEHAAVHLNDTHPALAAPELLRLLMDERHLDWDAAWKVVRQTLSYTNHTLMPEALETWPMDLLNRVLPRPAQIIEQLNEQLLSELAAGSAGPDVCERMSLIDTTSGRARMGHLSVYASHRVNGVSAVHSQLVRQQLFSDFAARSPERFCNVTNGITQRRWLAETNPYLTDLIDARIGVHWRNDLEMLQGLREATDEASLISEVAAAKRANKVALAHYIAKKTGNKVDPNSLFDVQIKRFHEYKRQLLNLMQVVARYQRIVANSQTDIVPRTVIFAGKAASSYWMAKLIIKLINDVAGVINEDARVRDLLKVIFLPDYGVTLAQRIIPAADLSEQISTAGTEASGTGNMKLALNGALTIGTEDGANIEIRDAVGAENIFIFGNSVAEVAALRTDGYEPRAYYDADPELKSVLDSIAAGNFSPDEPDRFQKIVESLLVHGDHYQLLADFRSYLDAQDRVDALWRDPNNWYRRAIVNIASMGSFSSDRAIRDYARHIWDVPVREVGS